MRQRTASEPFRLPAAPPPGISIRHARVPDDYARMNAIANAARAAGGEDFSTTDEQFIAFYSHLVNCDVQTDVAVAERRGSVVGYGRVSWHDESERSRRYELITYAEPSESPDVPLALLDAVECRAREIAAQERESRDRTLLVPLGGSRASMLAERGYVPVRFFYRMVRSNLDDLPDAPLPDGLQIRAVQAGTQLRTIFDAETEAFQDHWGSTLPTEEEFEQFASDPIQGRTDLWRVAWAGDQVAGMVRGFINEEENERFGRKRGYVEHISVRRPWRKRGLARALIAASITALREAGVSEGALGVDSENRSVALGLYRSCGFQVEAETTVYSKPLGV